MSEVKLTEQERAALAALRSAADNLAEAADAAVKLGIIVASLNFAGGKADLVVVKQTAIPMSLLNS